MKINKLDQHGTHDSGEQKKTTMTRTDTVHAGLTMNIAMDTTLLLEINDLRTFH